MRIIDKAGKANNIILVQCGGLFLTGIPEQLTCSQCVDQQPALDQHTEPDPIHSASSLSPFLIYVNGVYVVLRFWLLF